MSETLFRTVEEAASLLKLDLMAEELALVA